jgi:prepilin-type N-terminal cleavage/methylation domain-containing protein
MRTPPDPRRRTAFTLVEILIVVAIIAILASMAVMSVFKARMIAQERLAVDTLRQIANAAHAYDTVNQRFPASLTALGLPTSNPTYLNEQLIGDGTTSVKQGYTVTYTAGPDRNDYTLLGNPQQHGLTGERHYYVDRAMVIRYTTQNLNATASDPPIS